MFENTSDLAENKLLLLYILTSLRDPISNYQLTEIVLENNLINYFTLQQYITELENSEFINFKAINDKKLLYITKKGENVLSFFKDRISPSRKIAIDSYLGEKITTIKKELSLQSDYTPLGKEDFLVNLVAFEDTKTLIDLKISVPTKKHAISLCSKWKENYSSIYTEIISLLFNDKEE